MIKKIFIARSLWNSTVTSNNFDIIRDASRQIGLEIVDNTTIGNCIKKGSRSDIYVVTNKMHALYLIILGRKNIAYWYQGINPEEYIIGREKNFGFIVRSYLEKVTLKKVRLCLFVSTAMQEHYENKYHIDFQDRSYIFPCFNTSIKSEAFSNPGKYNNNYFLYAGGTAIWQCFDETLAIYKKIEELGLPNTQIIVMTKDKEYANKKIKELGINNYEVGFTTKENLPHIISKAKFGFVIRKDDPVNRVSTPTKISSYLSCGIIPIYGKCIKSFDLLAENMEYAISWDNSDDSFNNVIQFMKRDINKEDVYNEYKRIFDTVFSYDYHRDNISRLFKTIFSI